MSAECRTNRTVTFNPDEWQLVPRKATRDMLMGLQPRAGDIVKMERKNGGKKLHFCCDFRLVYQLMLAAAPIFTESGP